MTEIQWHTILQPGGHYDLTKGAKLRGECNSDTHAPWPIDVLQTILQGLGNTGYTDEGALRLDTISNADLRGRLRHVGEKFEGILESPKVMTAEGKQRSRKWVTQVQQESACMGRDCRKTPLREDDWHDIKLVQYSYLCTSDSCWAPHTYMGDMYNPS